MIDNQTLIQHIVDAIQERKGKNIKIVDMTEIDSVCDFFVICDGTSNTQIAAICDSVWDGVREKCGVKPFAAEGMRNALWIAMDYGDIMVHIFDRETRQFYDLEHLWDDASLTEIPDLD